MLTSASRRTREEQLMEFGLQSIIVPEKDNGTASEATPLILKTSVSSTQSWYRESVNGVDNASSGTSRLPLWDPA
jgi:hypothetical protein